MFSDYFLAKKKIYPQLAKGRFRRLKNYLNLIFFSIYAFTPFVRFSRGDHASNQAIMIDLPNSKAYFFFIEIWPQEVYYLAAILIILAVALFFITSLFGRIWCGYACFQTVWTDIFIAIERFFQGDRNQRIILDRKNNFNKLWRKTITHFSWIIISFLTGLIFCSYFTDAFNLYKNI
jgi:polyferredoxin